ncbi:RHS repeat-associated core domain-containing protein [Actinomadura rubrisoli]|uniref:DUF4258 domain-containing protein n=1 Tax=Actinomadura rubrisoli TaxID=2530368 RepID=A0A4R5BLQ6_9ACTN|nr:RHS repeat-associated core domain-containing protein [Actinomadura rubrisoli]TDD84804.1 DUF4258 domain-containing protein [Actinomadura rubrisoli]
MKTNRKRLLLDIRQPLRHLAAGVSVVMAMGLASAPAAQADPPHSKRPKVADQERTVKGRDLKVRPRTPDPATRSAPKPKASWPHSGTAEVTLTGKQAKRSGTVEGIVRAGHLPVALAAPGPAPKDTASKNAAARPALKGSAKVTVLDQATAHRAGVEGLVFTLVPDAKATAGRVGVRVDYSSFAQAFGGSYGTRLRLVQLPACALTTPAKPECRTSAPVTTANNGETKTLTADVETITPVSPTLTPMVLAAVAAPEGSLGDFKATKLEASATWAMSGNTGDFTWSYPMRVPPVPGGLSPKIQLGYSAQSVDGRTRNTNNQPSWAGEGFEFSPGFIERRYKSCEDDGVPNGPGGKPPGDLCWGYENAVVTWNGKGGELIKAADGTWRLKDDDGTRFERLTDPANNNGDEGDNGKEGEYWKVTTTDGTQYFFGRNHLPGSDSGGAETKSAWTVPVFGDDDGEPCHKASGFAASWCQQAWRWNLDMVLDPNGNAIAYYYQPEINHYGRNLNPADATQYTRGGYLKSIDYGLRSNNVVGTPAARVLFDTAERCIRTATFDCAESKISTNPDQWADVPWDMNCNVGTQCKDGHGSTSPTFWSRKRLIKVTTQINKGAGWPYRNVDSWALDHKWGADTDERDLLATEIQHIGLAGPTAAANIALPKVTFNHTPKANRLDQANDGLPAYTRYRVNKIFDESGGEIDIAYSGAECSRSALPTPETNTKRCSPSLSIVPGQPAPLTDWFHKYVTTSVSQVDRTGRAPDMVTKYEYLGGAAWHFDDDDGLTRERTKTWSQWRGYGQVRTVIGSAGTPAAQTDTFYLRGMDGDRKSPGGGTKSVTVSDGEGGTHTDHEAVTGFTLKAVTYDKPDGNVHTKTVTTPWRAKTAERQRSWGTTTANITDVAATRTWTAKDGGGWTETRTDTTYQATGPGTGRATMVNDLGDLARGDDDKCTRTEYADNAGAWMLSFASRVETVAVACTVTPDRSKHAISDARTYYDGKGLGEAPIKGQITEIEKIAEHDGSSASYVTGERTKYDTYGRPVQVTDAAGQTATTAYTDVAGLNTQVTSTTPPAKPDDPATTLKTVAQLDSAWGTVIAKIDQSNQGLRTDLEYDALGRLTKIWLPNRSTKDNPSFQYEYRVADGQIVAVTTKTLTASGGQRVSEIELFDGLLRSRQTQEPGPTGRLIADTFYDERGQTVKTYAAYPAAEEPKPELFGANTQGDVETQARTEYDGLGRKTIERLVTGNQASGSETEKWHTSYSYGGGNRISVTPPSGGTPTAQFTDARGQVTERRQYKVATPRGEYDATAYTYTPAGQLATVTDPSGNVFTTAYDLRGRSITTTDPDKGTTTFTYDDLDRLVSSTDARGTKVFTNYDGLGRKTAIHDGSPTGDILASWTYDTVAYGKGRPAASIRHTSNGDYTSRVDTYDKLGRTTVSSVTVPTSQGPLAGTYVFSTTYNLDDTIQKAGVPAAGGLPAEDLQTSYDDYLRPLTLTTGQTTYVGTTQYTPTGKPKLLELGATGKRTWNTQSWEYGTQRLAGSRTYREGIAGDDRNAAYHYTDAGAITSITDTSKAGIDNQCFTYDHLQRLTQAWTQGTGTACAADPTASLIGGPAPYWQTFTYDKAGNRTKEIRHGTGGLPDTVRAYTYSEPGHGNRLNSIAQTGAAGDRTDTYTYDATGNTSQITRSATPASNTQTLDWNTEGQLAKVTENGNATTFVYDADGNRLVRQDPAGATLYLPDGTELRAANGAATATGTRYYTYAGQTIAQRTTTGVTYLSGDHQDTAQIAVNATDLKTTVRRTTPFGAIRGLDDKATWPNDKGFVGGTQDPTGYTHLGAREYDPETGRFISLDSIFDPADPQSWNGYTYSDNNPVTLSDSSGLYACAKPSECQNITPRVSNDTPRGNWAEKNHPGSIWHGRELGARQVKETEDKEKEERTAESKRKQKELQDRLEDEWAKSIGRDDDNSDGVRLVCGYIGDVQGCVSSDVVARMVMWYFGVGEISNCLEHKESKSCLSAFINYALKWKLRGKKPGPGPKQLCRRGSSFTPGTMILMADGSYKPIEYLRVGDKVISTDPKTGKTKSESVLATITSKGDKNLVRITIDGQGPRPHWTVDNKPVHSNTTLRNIAHARSGILIATDSHPFWVGGNLNQWVKAADLEPGMWLRTRAGTYVQVKATKVTTAHRQRVHNLTIAEHHTYYVSVGKTPVLVHNVPCVTSYSDHARRRMSQRGISEDMIEQTVRTGKKMKGKDPGTKKYKSNNLWVILNNEGKVVSVGRN